MDTDAHTIKTGGVGREVHEFMDQYFGEFGISHRAILHHKRGVEMVCAKFGEGVRWIVMQHLRADEYGGLYRGVPTDWDSEGFPDEGGLQKSREFARKLFA